MNGKILVQIVLIMGIALKLGATDAKGQNVPYSTFDICFSVGCLIAIGLVQLFVEEPKPVEEWRNQQDWLRGVGKGKVPQRKRR